MAELAVFVVLVGLIGAAGIALGMLAARRLGAWDERRAAADAVEQQRGSGAGPGVDPLEDGGDGVD